MRFFGLLTVFASTLALVSAVQDVDQSTNVAEVDQSVNLGAFGQVDNGMEEVGDNAEADWGRPGWRSRRHGRPLRFRRPGGRGKPEAAPAQPAEAPKPEGPAAGGAEPAADAAGAGDAAEAAPPATK